MFAMAGQVELRVKKVDGVASRVLAARKLPGAGLRVGCFAGKRLTPYPFIARNRIEPDIAYFVRRVRGTDFVLKPVQIVHFAGLLTCIVWNVRLAC